MVDAFSYVYFWRGIVLTINLVTLMFLQNSSKVYCCGGVIETILSTGCHLHENWRTGSLVSFTKLLVCGSTDQSRKMETTIPCTGRNILTGHYSERNWDPSLYFFWFWVLYWSRSQYKISEMEIPFLETLPRVHGRDKNYNPHPVPAPVSLSGNELCNLSYDVVFR